LKGEIESTRRVCKEYEETIDHLTSGCPILEKNEYIIRHLYITSLLNLIRKILGIETTEDWYLHIPKSVREHEDITELWNQGVQTDRFWQIGQTIKKKQNLLTERCSRTSHTIKKVLQSET
jgi:hypothetical protein